MIVRYELHMQAVCPSDNLGDSYQIIVEAGRTILVEDIVRVVAESAKQARYQEEHTQAIARTLGARVTSIGYHYGVKTTCSA